MIRLFIVLLLSVVSAGCYQSSGNRWEGRDIHVDSGETEPDVLHDQHQEEARPDIQNDPRPDGPVCGNGIIEAGEDCEGSDLGGVTCESLGMPGDGLACDADCLLDISGCGICGNGACEDSEDQFGCPSDCGAVAVSAGWAHTCAVLSDGTVLCWGNNGSGELGTGGHGPGLIPTAVEGMTDAAAVSAGGGSHTCAVLSDGTAMCWGNNVYGQLGDGTNINSSVPVAVSGMTGAVALSAGGTHTCSLLSDGRAMCWGYNEHGELGNGSVPVSSFVPVVVSGLTDAVSLSAGWAHTCAVLSDGTARCWGNNVSYQLGDGTMVDREIPVAVSGLAGAVAVTAGRNHTCALLSDGTAMCWGANGAGELGDGTTTDRSVPAAVSGLSDAVAISTGIDDTCAVLSDETARCWGDNTKGQLGDGTNTSSPLPVAVSGLPGVASVSAGESHTCAVLSDGTAMCWGNNGSGQLGTGTHGGSNVPVQVAAW